MNLGEIEGGIFDILGYEASPDSAVVRTIRRHINTTHRELLTRRRLSKLRRQVLTFTAVANNPYAVLPSACVKIAVITDRTNGWPLEGVELQDLRYRDPRLSSLTNPDAYAVINFSSAVAQHPSAAVRLYAVSDDANDGSGLAVFVEGIVTGGYYRRASVAMNGLTAVAIDSANTWEVITKFYVSSAAVGNITLRETSGVGTELARITAGRTYSRYTMIQLSPTPSTGLTYHADVVTHLEDMVAPKDEPIIPEDWHFLLEAGALMAEWKKREKMQLWSIEQDRWKEGIKSLEAFVASTPSIGVSGQRSNSRVARFSQLGSNFPAGS